jgi:hypothetical protein
LLRVEAEIDRIGPQTIDPLAVPGTIGLSKSNGSVIFFCTTSGSLCTAARLALSATCPEALRRANESLAAEVDARTRELNRVWLISEAAGFAEQ